MQTLMIMNHLKQLLFWVPSTHLLSGHLFWSCTVYCLCSSICFIICMQTWDLRSLSTESHCKCLPLVFHV